MFIACMAGVKRGGEGGGRKARNLEGKGKEAPAIRASNLGQKC